MNRKLNTEHRTLRTQAVDHLRKHDPVMRTVIDAVGEFDLQLQRNRFQTLVRSIVSQQISTAAARAIRGRLEELVGGVPTAARLSQLSIDELRSAGVSRQKGGYMLDLAAKAQAGEIRFRRHARMSDEEIIEELTQVKGIGRWTAQMFLIFSLGRMDVMPHDDLGVRTAIRRLYSLEAMPDKADCLKVAKAWRPTQAPAVGIAGEVWKSPSPSIDLAWAGD